MTVSTNIRRAIDKHTILPVSEMVFQDRREAGRVLGHLVSALPDIQDGLVLGLVRGGVPVAYEVARACGLSLEVLVVRKLGVPGQEELAMGAVASGGGIVLNDAIIRAYRVSEKKVEDVIQREVGEMEKRERLYREGRPVAETAGRTVILVDDGLATGASMRAAIRTVKAQARQVIVAVPVGSRSTCDSLASQADAIICALTPEPLDAVSLFYKDFEPTSDEELKELLKVR